MRIWLDMDGVIVDLVGPWLEWLNNRYNLDLVPSDIDSWYVADITKLRGRGYTREEVNYPLTQYDFWLSLPIYPGAKEAVQRWQLMGHDVRVASTPYNGPTAGAKFEWMNRNLPEIPWRHINLSGDKSTLIGDVMVDDKVDNLAGFRGHKVFVHQPWNISDEWGVLADNDYITFATYHTPLEPNAHETHWEQLDHIIDILDDGRI